MTLVCKTMWIEIREAYAATTSWSLLAENWEYVVEYLRVVDRCIAKLAKMSRIELFRSGPGSNLAVRLGCARNAAGYTLVWQHMQSLNESYTHQLRNMATNDYYELLLYRSRRYLRRWPQRG